MNRDRKKEIRVQGLLRRGPYRLGDVYYFDSVGSTMDAAMDLELGSLEHRTLLVADVQTEGRGRFGRRWHSTEDDLTFSFVLTRFDNEVPYSMIGAFAVYRAFQEQTESVRLKWINDVLWINGKKISGALSEERQDRTVIGIGVNLNTASLPQEMSGFATSFFIETGKRIPKEIFLRDTVLGLLAVLERVEGGGIEGFLSEWEEQSGIRGKRVCVSTGSGEFRGVAAGIDKKTGALLVDCGGAEREFYEGSLEFL